MDGFSPPGSEEIATTTLPPYKGWLVGGAGEDISKMAKVATMLKVEIFICSIMINLEPHFELYVLSSDGAYKTIQT